MTALLQNGEQGLIETFGREALTAIRQIEARLLAVAENWRWVALRDWAGRASQPLSRGASAVLPTAAAIAAADARREQRAAARGPRAAATLGVQSTSHSAGGRLQRGDPRARRGRDACCASNCSASLEPTPVDWDDRLALGMDRSVRPVVRRDRSALALHGVAPARAGEALRELRAARPDDDYRDRGDRTRACPHRRW